MSKNHQKTETFNITVKVIRSLKGGGTREQSELHCQHLQDGRTVADRLQREFDEDADPCRTYVYRGNDPAPIYAGLANYFHDRKKDTERKGVRRFN